MPQPKTTRRAPAALRALALALPLALAAALTACGAPEVDAEADYWGAPVAAEAPMPLGEVLDQADALSGTEVAIRAEVVEVCQAKGCWILLTDGDREMRVRFVDYAFFVPMDLTGEIVVEGTFEVTMQSVEDTKHYLEDAGKHEEAEAVTEPIEVYSLMATGVRRA